jgi:hypothetical protein
VKLHFGAAAARLRIAPLRTDGLRSSKGSETCVPRWARTASPTLKLVVLVVELFAGDRIGIASDLLLVDVDAVWISLHGSIRVGIPILMMHPMNGMFGCSQSRARHQNGKRCRENDGLYRSISCLIDQEIVNRAIAARLLLLQLACSWPILALPLQRMDHGRPAGSLAIFGKNLV